MHISAKACLWFSGPVCFVPLRQQSSVRGPSLDDPHWCVHRCHLYMTELVGVSILEKIFDFPGFSNVEIGVTSDGKTVVCYHPTIDIPYEFTQVSLSNAAIISMIKTCPVDINRSVLPNCFINYQENHIMTLNYFAAYRTARPPNKPSWVPRSGAEGPPQQGDAE